MHTLSFHGKLNKFVDDNELLPQGAVVIVACSGGPDSLALLDWLLSQRDKRQLTITVAHFDHGIRGEASRADAAFVHDFCVSRDIPCRIGHGDALAYSRERGLSLETAARELRYSFLRKVAMECFSAIKPMITRWDTREVYLAVGHHGDDQAETVLMRLLRGTGVSGLAAMRPYRLMTEWQEISESGNGIFPFRCRLIRPLLALSRREIEEYCRLQGLEPRRDATNDNPNEALRNKLRLELLPQLREEYNPDINSALCRLAEIAADLSDLAESAAAEKIKDILADNIIDRPAFSLCPKAIQQMILRHLPAMDKSSYRDIERMRRLICRGESGQQLNLPGAVLRLEYDKAIYVRGLDSNITANKIEKMSLAFNDNENFTKVEFCGKIIKAERGRAAELQINISSASDEGAAIVDADKVRLPLMVRTRRPGDAYRLPGEGNGRKKVKDFFIDRKIPRDQRDEVPIIVDGDDNIIWLAGLIRSGWAAVDKGTENIIRITIEQWRS